jgi:hypothetical protein
MPNAVGKFRVPQSVTLVLVKYLSSVGCTPSNLFANKQKHFHSPPQLDKVMYLRWLGR